MDPRLGLRGRLRHRHGDRPRPPPAREDRGRPRGPRLSRRSGAWGTGSARDRPPRRRARDARRRDRARLASGSPRPSGLQLAGLALLAVTLPLAAVLLSGPGHVPHGRRREDPRRRRGVASVAVGAALLRRASIATRIRRLRDASRAIAPATSPRAPTRTARPSSPSSRVVQHHGGELERLFDARRELVAWASHDLRTPIGSLQAMLEASRTGSPSRRSTFRRCEQVRTLRAGRTTCSSSPGSTRAR